MLGATYDVTELNVEGLLKPDSVAFEVPTFQRRYAWRSEEVEELLADLYENDDWMSKSGEALPYFLGSIVLAKSRKSDGSSTDLVLDGQQRITTVSLILAVFKHKLEMLGSTETETFKSCLLTGELGETKVPKIKLQKEDEKTYVTLCTFPDQCAEPEFRKNLLVQAVRKISAGIDEYSMDLMKKHQLHTQQDALIRMAKRLLYSVKFVRITAPTEAAAFRLFETLNDRGLALSAADLIKNKIFSDCGEKHRDEVRESWKEITEAVGNDEVVNFLRNFMIAFYKSSRKETLYDDLKNVIEEKKKMPAGVIGFVTEIKEAALVYKHIASPTDQAPWGSDTVETLKRINTFRARSCRPALLICARRALPSLGKLARAVEVTTVRYSIVGEHKPVTLEKAYAYMCKGLRKNPKAVDEVIAELAQFIPKDAEFKENFSRLDVDNVSSTWREILISLNNILATGETRVQGPDKVHVEHILPRSPAKAALIEANLTLKEAAELSSRIGNLTLLDGKKNQSVSNKEFSYKRPFFEGSEISLNINISKQLKWGSDEIEARSQELAQLAVQAWPWVF